MCIEKTTQYVTNVDTLTEAFAFVMEKVEELGERPKIAIIPISVRDADVPDSEWAEEFEVTVAGMVTTHTEKHTEDGIEYDGGAP